MGQKTAVNWTPREANREADALANGNSSGFDPAKEIKFDLAHMHWRILPDALQMGHEAEDAVHDAKDVERSWTGARNNVADDLKSASR